MEVVKYYPFHIMTIKSWEPLQSQVAIVSCWVESSWRVLVELPL